MTKIKLTLIILAYSLLPIFSFAADENKPGLVPCTDGRACNFGQLMQLIWNVMNFLLFKLSLPIAAVMFAWAGILMITGGGEAASARTKAKNIFVNTIFGLVIALAAWLIVGTILRIVGWDGEWIGFPG
jgi:hypothetical protein